MGFVSAAWPAAGQSAANRRILRELGQVQRNFGNHSGVALHEPVPAKAVPVYAKRIDSQSILVDNAGFWGSIPFVGGTIRRSRIGVWFPILCKQRRVSFHGL